MKTILALFCFAWITAPLCAQPAKDQKIGVLLVNHGSRSATWRQALYDLEAAVRPAMLANSAVQGLKTAHMEYTEPSIATRLKEFDAEAFSDIIIVPVFLSVSSHTFDDIPTIIGQKTDPQSLETLKIERIERYKPKARTVITPNLDFTDLLKKNILRRAQALSSNPADEGLVLIAYGDATYEKEWSALLHAVGDHVKQNLGITAHSHGWCGHVAHYDPAKTSAAIEQVLASRTRALVVPVLVAHDEMFQIKIIGDGIAKVREHKARVAYRPDAILPDPGVQEWVLDITRQYAKKVSTPARVAANP